MFSNYVATLAQNIDTTVLYKLRGGFILQYFHCFLFFLKNGFGMYMYIRMYIHVLVSVSTCFLSSPLLPHSLLSPLSQIPSPLPVLFLGAVLTAGGGGGQPIPPSYPPLSPAGASLRLVSQEVSSRVPCCDKGLRALSACLVVWVSLYLCAEEACSRGLHDFSQYGCLMFVCTLVTTLYNVCACVYVHACVRTCE